ncbi:MAG: hypothetical protein RBS57_06395 [Desulforhabdus sp.]|jgi:hypothetical protein|nr:hypothetical protein [Desulforhabdus sp.]
MNDEISTLYQAAKALITYIDKEEVFDRAAAGGCSGLDFHQSDTFYDLIVQTREVVAEIENGAKNEVSDEESDKKVRAGEAYSRLFDALKALAAHVEQERAFD